MVFRTAGGGNFLFGEHCEVALALDHRQKVLVSAGGIAPHEGVQALQLANSFLAASLYARVHFQNLVRILVAYIHVVEGDEGAFAFWLHFCCDIGIGLAECQTLVEPDVWR